MIVDIKSSSLATDRVALLGDGAFSARPHAAADTAKAAEDGWKLVEALQAHDSIADALTAWEQTQLQLGQALVDRCRKMGERSQFLNTWTPATHRLPLDSTAPATEPRGVVEARLASS